MVLAHVASLVDISRPEVPGLNRKRSPEMRVLGRDKRTVAQGNDAPCLVGEEWAAPGGFCPCAKRRLSCYDGGLIR